jgi:2-methylaconitate cis-trans-isomerase PrpF
VLSELKKDKILEVIPKPALVAKMRAFFRQQGGRSSNSSAIAMQADAVRREKEPFAAQMRFWDGF